MSRGLEKSKPALSPSGIKPERVRGTYRFPNRLFAVALVGCTFLVYLPALNGQFVWDDDSWTTNITHLLRDFAGLRAMWCNLTALQQYFPLTGTTFWLDYQLWGFWTLPYHVENVLLHALAALLVWRLLDRLKVPAPWLVAAIFALHPVMVESAGWITERKNVLSMCLYLGALLAYGKFVGFWNAHPAPLSFEEERKNYRQTGRKGMVSGTPIQEIEEPNRKAKAAADWRAYALALFLFILAMLAKTTAFSLPPVLLLLAWWKLGRLRWRKEILPTVPFFGVAIGLGLVTSWVERHHVGTGAGPEWNIAFPERCLIAGRALWFYAGKLFWPANLCFVYPRWHIETSSLGQWLFPVIAAAVVAALWLARSRTGRGPLTAVLFFVGTLSPLLGFINGYFMRYSFVCDHWAYLSNLGLITLAVGLLARAVAKLNRPTLVPIVAAVILPILGILSWHQAGMYRDMETLWRVTLTKNPGATLAQISLGNLLYSQRRAAEAVGHFEDALRVQPDSVDAHSNLGAALLNLGRVDEAITHLRRAIAIQPTAANAHNNLGNALLQTGKLDEAVAEFQKTVEFAPGAPGGHYNLGTVLLQAGRAREAIVELEHELELQPTSAEVRCRLGEALLQDGRADEAVVQLRRALELQPNLAEAHFGLAGVLLQKANSQAAIDELQKALAIQPTFAAARNNLGSVLLSLKRVDEAITQLETALKIQPDFAEAHNNLANAFFQKGRPTEAVAEYQAALAVQPENPQLINNLAWALATCPEDSVRNATRAVELAREANRLTGGKNPQISGTLAAALAEAGKFTEAIAAAERALQLATTQTNADQVKALQTRLALYRNKKPFRDEELQRR